MIPFDLLARDLRDLAARRCALPTDLLVVMLRRAGLTGCLFKWTFTLADFPELWPDELPEADSDGTPTLAGQRAILLALLPGPRKVEVLARELRLNSSSRLYGGQYRIRELVALGLVILGEDGYALTLKGRRVAEAIGEDE